MVAGQLDGSRGCEHSLPEAISVGMRVLFWQVLVPEIVCPRQAL